MAWMRARAMVEPAPRALALAHWRAPPRHAAIVRLACRQQALPPAATPAQRARHHPAVDWILSPPRFHLYTLHDQF
jgi:hypothetical protein